MRAFYVQQHRPLLSFRYTLWTFTVYPYEIHSERVANTVEHGESFKNGCVAITCNVTRKEV